MKRNYLEFQFITGFYTFIYLAALYFASGYGKGFKLDGNQLIGYILCIISLLFLLLSFLLTTVRQEKLIAILLFLDNFLLFTITLFNIISFNESFWYFILFVLLIPWVELLYVISIIRSK